MSKGVNVVNIVASGNLEHNLDLEQVAGDIEEAEYKTQPNPALHIRFDEDGPLILVYRSGKYIVRGGDSNNEMDNAVDRFLRKFSNLGIISEPVDPNFVVKNVVFTGDVGTEIDLSKLAAELEDVQVDYEPEQFPGLTYYPKGLEYTVRAFSTGKTILTGGTEREAAEAALNSLREKVASQN